MSQPAPMDLSRLKGILSGAKAVMNKVDNGDYSTGNVQLDLSGENLIEAHQVQGGGMPVQGNTQSVAPTMQGGQAVYKNMSTSKLPDNIKEAMMAQPIPQMSGPNHTFNLADVSDLVEKPMPTQVQHQQRQAQPRQQVTENVQYTENTFTVSESALIRIVEDIVDKKLNSFMTESYNKNLTEQAIKRTINTLIKEGKIKTKKTVNS